MKMSTVTRPASFLFATWEGGGNVAPVATLTRTLIARGHSVRLMSDVCNRAEAESAGVRFVPWLRAPSRPNRDRETCPVRDWEVTTPHEGLGRMIDRIMFGPALEYAQDLLAELQREPADLVVSSDMLFGVLAACESVGQRCAIFSANLCFYPVPGLPAFGPGLPPPQSDADRELHEQIRANTRELLNRGLKGLNRARVTLGLRPAADVVDQLGVAERVWIGTSRAFDFSAESFPQKFVHVGPQLGEPNWVAPWQAPWPANDARPLVLAAFSTTFQNHAEVLQRIIDAAARLPVRLLVTLGNLNPNELTPAANTAVVPSAPHDTIMPHAALVITHGGHGTVMRALRHERPMLVLPHGRDQSENAIRVVTRGAGLMLNQPYETAAIAIAIEQLLRGPSFALAAHRLGRAVAEEANSYFAIQELEAHARPATDRNRRIEQEAFAVQTSS